MKLSMRIRIARQQARFSQEALALNLGVTRSAVANWECIDNVLPASARLAKLAELTGVSYEWLATGRGAMAFAHNETDISAPVSDTAHDAQERRLLAAFRQLNTHHRQRFITSIEAELSTGRAARSR